MVARDPKMAPHKILRTGLGDPPPPPSTQLNSVLQLYLCRSGQIHFTMELTPMQRFAASRDKARPGGQDAGPTDADGAAGDRQFQAAPPAADRDRPTFESSISSLFSFRADEQFLLPPSFSLPSLVAKRGGLGSFSGRPSVGWSWNCSHEKDPAVFRRPSKRGASPPPSLLSYSRSRRKKTHPPPPPSLVGA